MHGYTMGNSVVAGLSGFGKYFRNTEINVNIGTADLQHPGIADSVFNDYVIDGTTEVVNANKSAANLLSNF